MVGGIFGIFGLGTLTALACAAVVSLSIVLCVVAAIRQRPRVVITPQEFTIYKIIGCESHKWDDIDGQFAVIKIGWSKAVAYHMTTEYKTRVGKKPTSMFSGYDAAVMGALRSSPEELAALLNEHKQRSLSSPTIEPKLEALS
jgi:hypothetical protein